MPWISECSHLEKENDAERICRDTNGVALTDQLTASNQRTTSVAAKQMVETLTQSIERSLSAVLESSVALAGWRHPEIAWRSGAEAGWFHTARNRHGTRHQDFLAFPSPAVLLINSHTLLRLFPKLISCVVRRTQPDPDPSSREPRRSPLPSLQGTAIILPLSLSLLSPPPLGIRFIYGLVMGAASPRSGDLLWEF